MCNCLKLNMSYFNYIPCTIPLKDDYLGILDVYPFLTYTEVRCNVHGQTL